SRKRNERPNKRRVTARCSPTEAVCKAGCDAVLHGAFPGLLRGGVRRPLGAAVAARPRRPAPGRQLLLLRLVEHGAGAADLRLDHGGLLFGPRHRGQRLPAPAAAAVVPEPGGQPGPVVLLQVRQLLSGLAAAGAAGGGGVGVLAGAVGGAAGRDLVLHLPGHQLHGGCLPGAHPGGAEPAALPGAHPVLPRPGGRARASPPRSCRRKRWSWPRMHVGLQYVLMGLFKKLAIADRMALFADPVFAHPGDYTSYVLWVAMLAYALQVYCDFSGYTDM